MSFGNLKLFTFCVSRETQNFESILERRWNGVPHVCGCVKENLRQVVFDVEIVILESMILVRIEYFKEVCDRIATEVGAQLVYRIQEYNAMHAAGLLHHLDDLELQFANVCSTM